MSPDQLFALRRSLQLTQAQMAKHLGLKRVRYNRVENGHAELSPASLLLAEHLRANGGDKQ